MKGFQVRESIAFQRSTPPRIGYAVTIPPKYSLINYYASDFTKPAPSAASEASCQEF